MVKKLQNFKVQKMGQILCVEKVPFRKSGHIYTVNLVYLLYTYSGTSVIRTLQGWSISLKSPDNIKIA